MSKHVKTHTNPSARNKAQKLLQDNEGEKNKLPTAAPSLLTTMEKKMFSLSEINKSDPVGRSRVEVTSTTRTPEPDSVTGAAVVTSRVGSPTSRNYYAEEEKQKQKKLTPQPAGSSDQHHLQRSSSPFTKQYENFDLNNNTDSSSNCNNKQSNDGFYQNNMLENDMSNKNMSVFSIMNKSKRSNVNGNNNNNNNGHKSPKKIDNNDSSQFSILSPAPSTTSSQPAVSPCSRSSSRDSSASSVESNNSLSGLPIVMQSPSMTYVKPVSPPSFYSNQFGFHPDYAHSSGSPTRSGRLISSSGGIGLLHNAPNLTNFHASTTGGNSTTFGNNAQLSSSAGGSQVHHSHVPFLPYHFTTSNNSTKAGSLFW